MGCSLVGNGELVGLHGQPRHCLTRLMHLSSDALPISLGIETGRATSCVASPQAASNLVDGLRNDRTDAPSADMSADRARGVRAIREDRLRSTAWSRRPTSQSPWRHTLPGSPVTVVYLQLG